MKPSTETTYSSQERSAVSLGQTADPIGKGPQRPPITDLAIHLGVHHSTVSLALRNSPKISTPVKQRIHQLAKDWGYVPNQAARSLRNKRTKLIGIAFPFAAVSHYGMLLDRLCRQIEKLGFRSEVIFHGWNEDREKAALRTLIEQQVEGLLLTPSVENPEPLLREVLPPNLKMPTVMLGRPARTEPGQTLSDCVALNGLAGSRTLARHLLSRGHSCAALLMMDVPRGRGAAAMRAAGMRNEYRRHENTHLHIITPQEMGKPYSDRDGEVIWQHGGTADGANPNEATLADHVLSLRPLPTAVVTSDEVTAHALLSMLTARGLSIPEDMSIACFGGTHLSAFGAVPLTSVDYPYDESARVALNLLLHSNQTSHPQIILLKPTFVDRGSVLAIAPQAKKT